VYGLLAIIVSIVLAFSLEMFGLQWDMFFKQRHQNVERKTFEATQSYVQGGVQDLARYYEEYQKASEPTNKEIIRQVIIMRFAQFDANKIDNYGLKMWLVNLRGY
jgi:hypothetical protein